MSSSGAYAERVIPVPPPWHGLVVWDLFLNAVATGLFVVAATAELLHPTLFSPAARWVYPVALLVLTADLVCLVLDLGDPLKFHHMLRVMKLTSPMSFGTWSLTAFSLPVTAIVGVDLGEYVGLISGDWSAVRAGILILGIASGFCAMLYKGVLFSTTAQPGWREARWLGGYHTSSAVLLGTVGLFVATLFTGPAAAGERLRVSLVGLALIQLVPFGLLVRNIATTIRTRSGSQAVWRLALGGMVPTLAGVMVWIMGAGWLFGGLAAVLIVGAAFYVRSVVIRLPHA